MVPRSPHGESVHLRCTEGYTLTGSATGTKTFELGCRSESASPLLPSFSVEIIPLNIVLTIQ